LNLCLLFFGGKEEEHGWKASKEIVSMAFKRSKPRHLKERIEQGQEAMYSFWLGGKIITIILKFQWEEALIII